eukprot:scaffold6563_cov76-Skeletonema_dohrnii-CCMP3373.AAC.1
MGRLLNLFVNGSWKTVVMLPHSASSQKTAIPQTDIRRSKLSRSPNNDVVSVGGMLLIGTAV